MALRCSVIRVVLKATGEDFIINAEDYDSSVHSPHQDTPRRGRPVGSRNRQKSDVTPEVTGDG